MAQLPPVAHAHNPQPACAVMVAYYTGSKLAQVVTPLMQQVTQLIIVCTGADDRTREAIDRLTHIYETRITVFHHGKNNLAAAQNIGINEALRRGFDWVLLMDDDSEAATDMVKILIDTYHAQPEPDSIGIMAPALYDKHSNRTHKYHKILSRWRAKRVSFGEQETLRHLLGVIASGSLIPSYSFDLFGMMDESFCIDYVDKEFCLRVVRGGYQIMAVREAKLFHQLGKCHDHELAGLKITTTNHCPQRRYYIYRNRYYSWKKHGSDLPAYLISDMCGVGYDLFRILCFESGKRAKLNAMWRGLYDAYHGVTGEKKLTHQSTCFAKVSGVSACPITSENS